MHADFVSPNPLFPEGGSCLVACSERVEVLQPDFAQVGGIKYVTEPDGATTWDLGREVRLMRIDGLGNMHREKERMSLYLSNDGFIEDVRTVEVQTIRRERWVLYYYGSGAVLSQISLASINENTRFVRIGDPGEEIEHGWSLDDHWHNAWHLVSQGNPGFFNREIGQDIVFRADRPRVSITRTLASDIDGDGEEEVLAAGDNNQIVVLGSDGSVRWSYTFDAPVRNFICEDMDADGIPEVIVASHNHYVSCFSQNGEMRYGLDLLAEENTLRAVPNSICVYDVEDGRRGLVIPTYNRALKYDADGLFVKEILAPGFYEDTCLPVAIDFNADQVGDIIVRENRSGIVSFLDGHTFTTKGTAKTYHAGDGLGMVAWTLGDGTHPDAVLVVAKSGVSMLRPGVREGVSSGGDAQQVVGGFDMVFSTPISPIVGWDVADISGDEKPEIIIASMYGKVMVLNEKGKTILVALPAAEVNDVAVIRSASGDPRILVSCRSKLVLLDEALQPVDEEELVDSPCVAVQGFRSGGVVQAMCFFGDGTAAAYRCN